MVCDLVEGMTWVSSGCRMQLESCMNFVEMCRVLDGASNDITRLSTSCQFSSLIEESVVVVTAISRFWEPTMNTILSQRISLPSDRGFTEKTRCVGLPVRAHVLNPMIVV